MSEQPVVSSATSGRSLPWPIPAFAWPVLVIVAWAAFLAFYSLLQDFNLDFRLADLIYNLEGGHWALRNQYLLEEILHRQGRALSQGMGAVVILTLLYSLLSKRAAHWRRPLLYLFLAVGLSTLAVSVIKHLIPMECPWDLLRYGGSEPYIGLFTPRPDTMPDTACFPAGHASAGYAWISLYFFLAARLPRWRFIGLATGLLMGLVFGITQHLRGAHFLSHDLWTLMICWTIGFSLAQMLLRKGATARPESD